jgi:glycosyltransferase involved in cell wall biosynthesis
VVTVDSYSNGARHLIQDGENGSIVALDPDVLADAILYWMTAPRKSAIAAQVRDHDWNQLAQKQVEVYEL